MRHIVNHPAWMVLGVGLCTFLGTAWAIKSVQWIYTGLDGRWFFATVFAIAAVPMLAGAVYCGKRYMRHVKRNIPS